MTDNEKATARSLAGLVNPPQFTYPEGVTETVSRLQEAGFVVADAYVSLHEADAPTAVELVCPKESLLSEHSRVKDLLRAWGVVEPYTYAVSVTAESTLVGTIVILYVDDLSLEEAK